MRYMNYIGCIKDIYICNMRNEEIDYVDRKWYSELI